eukprot:NODE_741_length_4304_cov_0.498216.p1 type:complete len:577 gc:universal NODE_741_length_4304_cov_0.498216:3614-1884(-)
MNFVKSFLESTSQLMEIEENCNFYDEIESQRKSSSPLYLMSSPLKLLNNQPNSARSFHAKPFLRKPLGKKVSLSPHFKKYAKEVVSVDLSNESRIVDGYSSFSGKNRNLNKKKKKSLNDIIKYKERPQQFDNHVSEISNKNIDDVSTLMTRRLRSHEKIEVRKGYLNSYLESLTHGCGEAIVFSFNEFFERTENLKFNGFDISKLSIEDLRRSDLICFDMTEISQKNFQSFESTVSICFYLEKKSILKAKLVFFHNSESLELNSWISAHVDLQQNGETLSGPEHIPGSMVLGFELKNEKYFDAQLSKKLPDILKKLKNKKTVIICNSKLSCQQTSSYISVHFSQPSKVQVEVANSLKQQISNGVCYCHAYMEDRKTIERLFIQGSIKILCTNQKSQKIFDFADVVIVKNTLLYKEKNLVHMCKTDINLIKKKLKGDARFILMTDNKQVEKYEKILDCEGTLWKSKNVAGNELTSEIIENLKIPINFLSITEQKNEIVEFLKVTYFYHDLNYNVNTLSSQLDSLTHIDYIADCEMRKKRTNSFEDTLSFLKNCKTCLDIVFLSYLARINVSKLADWN